MGRGTRSHATLKTGSISEAVREEETLRYGASLLADSVINDTGVPLDPSRLCASSDAALAAFAQLGALRLNAERALISLFDGKRQHILAEAKQSTPIEYGPDDGPLPDAVGAPLLVSGTAIPREHGVCEHVLDRPVVVSEGNSFLPVTVVPDLSHDDWFASKPFFGSSSHFRFYAGVPLRTQYGIDIGVVCIFDSEPRDSLDAPAQRLLRHLSGLVMSHLQARVSTESYRRNERMVRGLGSMVEGMGSLSKFRNAVNPSSFKDVKGKEGTVREGALNVKQQRIQGQSSESSFAEPLRPVTSPRPADRFEAHVREHHPADSTDTLDSGAEGADNISTSATLPEEDDDENTVILRSLFSRAANIIRESVEVEGAVFLDASVGSFGRLVPQAEREADQNRSSGSSGEDSLATDDSAESTHGIVLCRVLGFSDSDHSSIDGDKPRSELSTVPDTFLGRLSRRYPDGQIINFGDDGNVIWAISDSEGSENFLSPSSGGDEQDKALQKRIRERPRKSDGAFLMRMFPGARSVAIIPLWDSRKERWFAGGFVWTKSRARVFSSGELSYLKAFGSAAMAEMGRMDVLRESKAKEDVLGSLSHEIRSPLHGVILGVELLHDSILTGFQEDVLHTVETCGRTLLDTLDHLLDFSKVNNFLQQPKRRTAGTKARGLRGEKTGQSSVQAGMMSIFSEVRLDLLMEEVIESVYAGFSFQDTSSQWATRERSGTSYFEQAGTLRRLESVRRMDTGRASSEGPRSETGVNVHLHIDPTVPWNFYAQPGALRRIIMNIFGNALKYTSRGHIVVSLTQEPIPSRKRSRRRTIILSISDSGCGISNDYLQNRLFTPFAQENQLSAGAGLGLSLVKQIIHGLGGRIGVESQVNRGTTIRVLIPLRLSSPRTSPTSIPQQLRNDFLRLLEELQGTSVTLLGFPDNFGEHQPLVVETGDLQSSPRASIEIMCQLLLHLKVVRVSEVPSTPPSVYICSEHALDQIAALNGFARKTPAVVVCDSHLSSHQHTAEFSSPEYPFIRECISQPVGPRKLARLLVFALERAKKAQTQTQVSGQVTPPLSTNNTDDTGEKSEAHQPLESSADVHELPLSSPESSHDDPITPMPLPLRPVQPQPAEAVENFTKSQPPIDGTSPVDGAPSVDGETLSPGPFTPPQQRGDTQPTITQEEQIPFLLVDDNAINMKMLASYMSKLGRGHNCAFDGLQALESCRARTINYRCIFMDISMPIMDGLESTRLIRAHERQHKLEPALIIALTGLASAKTQQEAFGSGIDLFLSRPVPLRELGRILEARGL